MPALFGNFNEANCSNSASRGRENIFSLHLPEEKKTGKKMRHEDVASGSGVC
jgi:hypothetical protein